MAEVKWDEAGFYYYEHNLGEYRVCLFRSKDIEEILQISPKGTSLENNFVDLHEIFLLCGTAGKEELALYLDQAFTGDHLHPKTTGAPRNRVVGNDILEVDRDWSGLVE